MLFDAKGVIKRYETAEDILREFFALRMEYYSRRRLALIQVRLGCPPAAHSHACQTARVLSEMKGGLIRSPAEYNYKGWAPIYVWRLPCPAKVPC